MIAVIITALAFSGMEITVINLFFGFLVGVVASFALVFYILKVNNEL